VLTCPVCGTDVDRTNFVNHYEQELRRLLLEQFGSLYEPHVMRMVQQLEAQRAEVPWLGVHLPTPRADPRADPRGWEHQQQHRL